jgi:hypothetical protein
MKRNIYIIIVMTFLGTLPFYGQRIKVGVTSGLNISTFSAPGNLYDNDALKTGFGGGLVLNYKISESFGLQSGFLYEQKGFRNKRYSSTGEAKLTSTFNYMTIPIVFEGSIPVRGNTRLYGNTGLYGGFKTYSENILANTESEYDVIRDDEHVNPQDFGWIFGGGVEFPAGNHLVQVGFRYSLGLAEVLESAAEERNKSLFLGVTLLF